MTKEKYEVSAHTARISIMESYDTDQSTHIYTRFRSLSPLQRRVLPRLMTRLERALLAFFIGALLVSGGYAISALINAYSVTVPAEGGSYREGIIGIPRFINPLLANSDVDRDLARMVYTGLLRHNGMGALVESLAERYEISDDGLVYTFYIRSDARWSDGVPLTTDDVIYTIALIKDPNYRSALRANWEGVLAEKIDERAVAFRLTKPYAPFLENATLGILPKHIWRDVLPAEFALSEYNLRPVGAGPYRAVSFEQNPSGRITAYILESNPHYLPSAPLISQVRFEFFASAADLEDALSKKTIDAASIPPASLVSNQNQSYLSFGLPRVFGVFFNQNSSLVLAEKSVREALLYATDRSVLVANVLHGEGVPAYAPIPPSTFGALDSWELKTKYAFDISASTLLLQNAGWKDTDEDGIREKEIDKKTVPISFTISTSDAPDLVATARLLQTMWKAIGADIKLSIFEIGDFEQNVLRPRKYEAVLFGEMFGYDPDPFAFWHSSQRNDPGLNIALYTNPRADALLQTARASVNPQDREQAYQEFQRLVLDEQPTIFLYSPNYTYLPAPNVHIQSISRIVIPSDRFGSVHEWYIKTKKQWKWVE